MNRFSKNIKIVFLLLFFIPSSFGQINSLKAELTKADSLIGEDQDSLALMILNSISEQIQIEKEYEYVLFHKLNGDVYLHERQLKKSAYHYQSVWDIEGKTKETTLNIAKAINDLGIVYYRLQNIDSAKLCHFKSLKLYAQYEGHQGRAFNFNNLAIIYGSQGLKDSSFYFQEQGIKAAKMAKDTLGIGYGHLNLGINYANVSNYSGALQNLLEAEKIFVSIKDTNIVNITKAKLSTVYLHLKETKLSLKILNELNSYYKNTNNTYQKGRIFYNLSNYYAIQEKYDSALLFIDKAIVKYKTLENTRWEPFALVLKGEIYYKMKKYDKAIEAYSKSLQLSSNKFIIDVTAAYSGLIKVYLENGNSLKANEIARTTLAKYKNKIRAGDKVNVYKALYINEKENKNFEKALQYYELVRTLSDSIDSKQKNIEYARIEYTYKLDKEQLLFKAKNEKIALELSRQKLLFYLSLGGVIAFVIISGLSIRTVILKRKKNQKLKDLNEEIKSQNEEISAQSEELKTTNDKLTQVSNFKESLTGMIAHDLKNPLSVILGSKTEKPSTKEMAKQMLLLVNNMLDVHKFENTKIQLNKVNCQLKIIISDAIEQIRPLLSNKNIELKLNIEPQVHVQVDKEYILRVLINLLTNAIKYSPNNATIEIITELKNNKIAISVQDQGKGIKSEDLENIFKAYEQINPKKSGGVASTGLGLTFCKLALIAHDSEIEVSSKVGIGTKFTFELAYISEEDHPTNESKIQTINIEFNEKVKPLLSQKVNELKTLKVHQAFNIENLLEEFSNSKNTALNNWAKSVIEAAYANNQEHYDELIIKMESLISSSIN